MVARLIALVFAGTFCIAGPLCLVVGAGSGLQRAALVYFGLHAEGTVIAKRPSGSSHVTYAPVFQFTASDGRAYVVISDVSGRESAFAYGERVGVLYQPDHPESARIDAFAPLWTFPLVFGVVGAAFSVIPALMWVNWRRKRQTGGADPISMDFARGATGAASPGFRWALGLILTGSGLVLLAVGLGAVSADAASLDQSRVLFTSLGTLLTACGVLVGQWVAIGSRLYHGLGGAAITSMAVVFGWVAVFGEEAGFRGGVGMGGVAVTSSSSATPARIAFGIVSIVFAVASLWAWKQVFRRRG